MVKNLYRNLQSFSTFCPSFYSVLKIAHRWKQWPWGHSCKSAHILESIIGMKIRPFVSYIKWLGELDSIGCVFIVCSLPFVHLILHEAIFSRIVYFIFLVESELFSSMLKYVKLLIVVYSHCDDHLVAPLCPYLYHKPKMAHIWTWILRASATSTTIRSSQQKITCTINLQ